MHPGKQTGILADIPSFLDQFAQSGNDWILARFDHPTRDLKGKVIYSKAELMHQHEPVIDGVGEHVHPIRRIHHDKVAGHGSSRMGERHRL